MLYVSTRNQKDTFTAYRALNEVTAPDGGVYVPFHLSAFTQAELSTLSNQPPCDTIAQLLNMFFGVHLSGLDVEFFISKTPFNLETMQHKFTVAECWKNPAYTYDYVLKSLYGLMADRKEPGAMPVGWSCVGIKVALLFGLYAQMGDAIRNMDIAVTAGDYSDLAAIAYAKALGLPVGMTVCACENDSAFWDVVNRGAYTSASREPDYMEAYLYILVGTNTPPVPVGLDDADEQQSPLLEHVYVAVVSKNRADSLISNMYRTNGYTFDTEAALAYGGLQDYRSSTGVSKDTLLFSKNRPSQIKE